MTSSRFGCWSRAGPQRCTAATWPACSRTTAGGNVAYAHALLRCDTPQDLAEDPEKRLRLTLGLRKEHGRWVVAHEHHSFPDAS